MQGMRHAHTQLRRYRAKRDFARTPEPSGKKAARARAGLRYVIQKHAARALHYDFRLELDGVLLSWAVPKGPSQTPGEKRLAMRTEDHPLEYADFEGEIPRGEYGGGTVAIWDRGVWKPEGDPHEGLKRGRLTFELVGERLDGRWHLVRTRLSGGKRESWLLMKGRDFALTHIDKVLYPELGITKGELAAYLHQVADRLLPHVTGRPLTLVRCPDGRHKQCFFQKHYKPGTPEGIERIPIVEESGERAEYLMIHDLAGLMGVAQINALELHPWGSRADKLERPDLLIFDLDPDRSLPWQAVVDAAFDLEKLLGLTSFAKTTGGKGLHVVAPISRRSDWERVKAFSKRIASALAEAHPDRYTINPLKAQRRRKIFIDYLRNGRGATAVAAWSPRAFAGATVATPISWDELGRGVDPQRFTLATVLERPDPWTSFFDVKQSLPR
jgi:bifunctional non-homologous end joining protein LigD